MFEMWNSVSSKLDQVHQTQSQAQQPHTSSGSIKGRDFILPLTHRFNLVIVQSVIFLQSHAVGF